MTTTPTAIRPWTTPQYGRCERCEADAQARLAVLSRQAKPDVELVLNLPDCGYCRQYRSKHMDLVDRIAQRQEEQAWHPAPKPVDVPPGPVLTCMAAVEPRPVSWLWPRRIPQGRITLLVGRPGEGKSYVTVDMAARVSTGTPWPDATPCPRGSVLLLTAEDDPADTIRPRLDAHHADVTRVHLLSAIRTTDGERLVTLADVDAIGDVLSRLGDCRLLVVDPVGSYLGGRTDAHRDNEVRAVLAPLAALAEKHGVAVVVVAHTRKATASVADDLAMGSRAFTGIARAVWHLRRDPENKRRRLLLPGKSNLAPEGDGLAFTIEGAPPRIIWERDPVIMTADDALVAEAARRTPGPESAEQARAVDWLREALAQGPRPAADLVNEWKNGQEGSTRTLSRAKQVLAAESYRPQTPGPWWWRLTGKDAKDPKDAKLNGELGNLGILAENIGFFGNSAPEKPKDAKLPTLGTLPPEGFDI